MFYAKMNMHEYTAYLCTKPIIFYPFRPTKKSFNTKKEDFNINEEDCGIVLYIKKWYYLYSYISFKSDTITST